MFHQNNSARAELKLDINMNGHRYILVYSGMKSLVNIFSLKRYLMAVVTYNPEDVPL